MDDNTLFTYDEIAAQVFWTGTRNWKERSETEHKFLTSFFDKYQLLIITENTYTNKDQKPRIQAIINRNQTLRTKIKDDLRNDIGKLHSKAEELLNSDLRIIMGEGSDIPEKWPIIPEPVVMAMFEPEKFNTEKAKQGIQNRMENPEVKQEIKQGLNNLQEEYPEQKITNDQLAKIIQREIFNLSQQQHEAFIQQAKHFENIEWANTGSSLDNQKLINSVRNMDKNMARLLEISEAGQKWENLTWKDIATVKWFKKAITRGLKNVALYSVAIPLYYGPKAVITETVIVPLKLVVKDIESLKNIFQRIWGWTLVAFLIGGVWVFMSDPDYEQQRTELYTQYSEFVEIIPVDILLEPTNITVRFLKDQIPGKIFFTKVLLAMRTFVINMGGTFIQWFNQALGIIFQTITDTIRSTMSSAISSWWSGK